MHAGSLILLARTPNLFSIATRSFTSCQFLASVLRQNACLQGYSTWPPHNTSTVSKYSTTSRKRRRWPELRARAQELRRRLRITLPDSNDPDEWANQLVTLEEKERTNQHKAEARIPAHDVFEYLDLARYMANVDVLTQLGVQRDKWEVVHWAVKKMLHEPMFLRPRGVDGWFINYFQSIKWPSGSLEQATGGTVAGKKSTRGVEASICDTRYPISQSLEAFTDGLDVTAQIQDPTRKFIGILWKSLGRMTIAAATRLDSQYIMPHVLRILADLHHLDLVPDTIYKYEPTSQSSTQRQPPLLHLHASRMMFALSDAAWNAHPTAVHAAVERSRAQYLLGWEIPGTRQKAAIPVLGPEIWLELILWSCLHNGHIEEGASLIAELNDDAKNRQWSLISWTNLVEEIEKDQAAAGDVDWNAARTFIDDPRSMSGTIERAQVERTISREIVALFADAVVDNMRTVVGTARGIETSKALNFLVAFKAFLDRANVGLCSASWNSIILRALDFGRLSVSMDTTMSLQLIGLAQHFKQGLPPDDCYATLPYTLVASGAPLHLLHEALEGFIRLGDAPGAFQALKALQSYADLNMQQSISVFFRSLLESEDVLEGHSDDLLDRLNQRPNPVRFPGFFPNLSPQLLAKLIQLMTCSGQLDLVNWLLHSTDIDGPLVRPELYVDENVAASVIQYAATIADRNLLRKTMQVQSKAASTRGTRLPAKVLQAALDSQLTLRRWESVEELLKMCRSSEGLLDFHLTVAFCKQILLTPGASEPQLLLREVLRGSFGRVSKAMSQASNVALTIVAWICPQLSDFCGQLCTENGTVHLGDIGVDLFNGLLEGVVQAMDTVAVEKMWATWCERPPMNQHHGPGTPRMPRLRDASQPISKGITVGLKSFPITEVAAQFRPDADTYRIIMRGVAFQYRKLGELDESQKKLVSFCRRRLRRLGLSQSQINSELALLRLPA